jgi:uncharacterized membrane protein (UPF0127 family)
MYKALLDCEVADTFKKKITGLMYRDSLADGMGMFFPFCFSWYRRFIMKDVVIPLDIIFIDKDFRIVDIYMAVVGSKGHGCFCKYVIETNFGFCKNNNILVGDFIGFREV